MALDLSRSTYGTSPLTSPSGLRRLRRMREKPDAATVSPLSGGRPGGPVLHQIPPVAVQVEEDSDGAVLLLPWLFRESHAPPLHVLVVPPEVVGLEEQEHPAPGL